MNSEDFNRKRFTFFYSAQYKEVNQIYLLEVGTYQEDKSNIKRFVHDFRIEEGTDRFSQFQCWLAAY